MTRFSPATDRAVRRKTIVTLYVLFNEAHGRRPSVVALAHACQCSIKMVRCALRLYALEVRPRGWDGNSRRYRSECRPPTDRPAEEVDMMLLMVDLFEELLAGELELGGMLARENEGSGSSQSPSPALDRSEAACDDGAEWSRTSASYLAARDSHPSD